MAFKNSRNDMNIKIFQDTMRWFEEQEMLSKAIEESRKRTVMYPENAKIELPESDKTGECKVEVTTKRTLDAATRLKRRYSDKKVGALNFASATNPGGGVEQGSTAQEEALCRCSTLYPCLTTPELKHTYYDFHNKRQDPLYTDACIYTPDVVVMKSDTDDPKRLPENGWCKVDIISCAAPNLRKVPYNKMNPGSGKAAKVTEEELLQIHKRRGRRIFSVAAANGIDIMVLGAFGCGAFQNPPEVVAAAYKEILPEFAGRFERIEFAVYCLPKDMENYKVFRKYLV